MYVLNIVALRRNKLTMKKQEPNATESKHKHYPMQHKKLQKILKDLQKNVMRKKP